MFAAPSGSRSDTPSPEVHRLLARAESFASDGRLAVARSVYRLAIERDLGQTARHAFGCFLARTDCDDDAIVVFRAVLEEARRSGNNRLRASAANNLATLHRQRGDKTIAAGYQQQAVHAEMHCPATGGELSSETLFGCAGDALLAGRAVLAEELYRRSLAKSIAAQSVTEQSKTEQSTAAQADNQGYLGILAAMTGDLDRAERSLRNAYHQHRDADDFRGAGVDLMNLASVFETTAQWKNAVLCLTLAAELFEQTGTRTILAQARRRLEQMIRILAVRNRDPLRN